MNAFLPVVPHGDVAARWTGISAFDLNTTKVTIYQLLDEGTRFDVGTRCFAQPENSDDAIATLRMAFEEYGVPQEILSDNARSFNQARRGRIGATVVFLAEHGAGASQDAPGTRGPKENERSHQTLSRFLDAHAPKPLASSQHFWSVSGSTTTTGAATRL